MPRLGCLEAFSDLLPRPCPPGQHNYSRTPDSFHGCPQNASHATCISCDDAMLQHRRLRCCICSRPRAPWAIPNGHLFMLFAQAATPCGPHQPHPPSSVSLPCTRHSPVRNGATRPRFFARNSTLRHRRPLSPALAPARSPSLPLGEWTCRPARPLPLLALVRPFALRRFVCGVPVLKKIAL